MVILWKTNGNMYIVGTHRRAERLSNRQRKNERDGNGFITIRESGTTELVISPEKDVLSCWRIFLKEEKRRKKIYKSWRRDSAIVDSVRRYIGVFPLLVRRSRREERETREETPTTSASLGQNTANLASRDRGHVTWSVLSPGLWMSGDRR